MKTFSIEFKRKGETQCEFVSASTSVEAVKTLINKLRVGKAPFILKIVRIREIK